LERPHSPRKLDCVDALRGLAVIAVILFHVRQGEGGTLHPALAMALAPFHLGSTGVHLFLVLSGFCLTHSLLRRYHAGRPTGLRSYLALPLAAALAGHQRTAAEVLDPRQLLSHFLFIHGFWADTIDAINTPFWSLSLEFQFYLVLPMLFALSARFGSVPVILAVAGSSALFRAWVFSRGPGWAHLINGAFPGRWTEFALGMGVAIWYNRPRPEAADRPPPPWWAWGLVSAGLLAVATALFLTRTAMTAVDLLFGGGYAALLAMALTAAERGRRIGAIVSFAPLVGAGVISYSLYLTHSFFLGRWFQLYRRLLPRPSLARDLAMVVGGLTLVLVGGWLYYLLIERHFARSLERGRSGRSATPSEGPAHLALETTAAEA
jgi:peptidoglycan/LPS O-acetylase OafA/YrhL